MIDTIANFMMTLPEIDFNTACLLLALFFGVFLFVMFKTSNK